MPARSSGGNRGGYVVVRLPYAVKDLFSAWLDQHFPARKEKILGRLREIRGGKLNDSRFGTRMSGEGEWAEVFGKMFRLQRKRIGLAERGQSLLTALFSNGRPKQGSLFE